MTVDTSIIITSHNKKPYIGRAIRSCLKQSLDKGRYEVIVVDDASTDDSQDVINGFKDKVTAILLDTNVGVAEASNIGIRAALGTFIMRVDADDYISENSVLFLTELLLANPDIGFVYSDHLRVSQNEKVLGRVDINTLDLLFRHGAGILFRKSYLEVIGLYDPEFRNAEDFDLLRKYIKNFDGYHLRMPLYRYRIHPQQMTNDEGARKRWENKSINNENR